MHRFVRDVLLPRRMGTTAGAVRRVTLPACSTYKDDEYRAP